MGRIRIACWAEKKGTDGRVPLYLICRHRKARSTVALPIRVAPRDWNAKRQQVRSTAVDHVDLNQDIADLKHQAETALRKAILAGDSDPTGTVKRAIKARLDGKPEGIQGDFIVYFGELLETYVQRRQWGTHEAYRVILEKLKRYVQERRGRAVLPFEALTVAWLEDFKSYLVSDLNNGPATVQKNLATIRTILYQAIREDLFPQSENPFFKFKLSGGKRKVRRPLSISEIHRLEDAELTGRQNDARNAFVFAFYEGGVRVSDVLQLRSSDIFLDGGIWRMGFEMEKTERESFPFPLWPSAERILRSYGWPELPTSAYIFPFMPAGVRPGTQAAFKAIKKKTALVNKYLRQVKEKLGIETPLTTHVARHSFSHYLDQKGWEIQNIQQLLRHSDSKTTESYLSSLRLDRYDERLKGAFVRDRTSKS